MSWCKKVSPSGTRTRAFRVKAEYPSHLDQWGLFECLVSIFLQILHLEIRKGALTHSFHVQINDFNNEWNLL